MYIGGVIGSEQLGILWLCGLSLGHKRIIGRIIWVMPRSMRSAGYQKSCRHTDRREYHAMSK